MNRHLNAISARMSLRKPQKESLEILANLVETIELGKHSPESLNRQLEKVRVLFY